MAFQKRGLITEDINSIAGGGVKSGTVYRDQNGYLYSDKTNPSIEGRVGEATGYIVCDDETGEPLAFTFNKADAIRYDRALHASNVPLPKRALKPLY